MFKKFTITICFILFSNIVFSNDEITKISVDGNQRIDVETVESYSGIELGDVYTEEYGNLVLRKLFDTNLFANIQVSFQENVLKINVQENPTINLVKFQGNRKIKDEDLLIEVSLKERSVYSRNKVKKDIERMLTLY